ncbi:UDP-glucuronosyltransferase 2A1-like [Elysia marginata]|uniref:UDP-glucuronosyltransferase 2A1-like n=1 Tax=Elysia marginata TaxID=1093978 RepID=A0AAV4IDB4_9GAST|nr:UDP-glucuronosyltransferase 2A1-like [Elysia marginata]
MPMTLPSWQSQKNNFRLCWIASLTNAKHGDQRKEDQDDAHWKGHKGAYNNSRKRSARAGLKILIPWTLDHGGCCHSERGTKLIRIGKTGQKFWKNKELLRRNVGLNTRKRLLACYIFSVFSYGCEA